MLYSKDMVIQVKTEDLEEYIKDACLLDNEYMSIFFEDEAECMQVVLRVILGKDDIIVKSVKTQRELGNIAGHSLRLDVLAEDSQGKIYNIEIQRDNRGAIPLRARYHASLLDTNFFQKGVDFKNIAEVYVIFITEHDIFNEKLPLYIIDRRFAHNGKLFGDRSHIIYLNTEYCGDNDIGHLASDFRSKNISGIHNEILANRAKVLKEKITGGENMSELFKTLIFDKYKDIWEKEAKDKGRKEGREEGKFLKASLIAKAMLFDKMDVNLISKYTGLSLGEIEELHS